MGTGSRLASLAYAAAAALLPVGVAHGWWTANDAQNVGIVVAALAAGVHGQQIVTGRIDARRNGQPIPYLPTDAPQPPPSQGWVGSGGAGRQTVTYAPQYTPVTVAEPDPVVDSDPAAAADS